MSAQSACPSCGVPGRDVGDRTLSAMLEPAQILELAGPARRFCRNRACAVVYYGEGGGAIGKAGIKVRVGLKEREDPVPLCYCFGHTRADLRAELAATGGSTMAARISAEIRAGRCACEIRNPSGACCLGEVVRAVEEEQEAAKRRDG